MRLSHEVKPLVWTVKIQTQTRIDHDLAILHTILHEETTIPRRLHPIIVQVGCLRRHDICRIVAFPTFGAVWQRGGITAIFTQKECMRLNTGFDLVMWSHLTGNIKSYIRLFDIRPVR